MIVRTTDLFEVLSLYASDCATVLIRLASVFSERVRLFMTLTAVEMRRKHHAPTPMKSLRFAGFYFRMKIRSEMKGGIEL